MDNSKVHWNSLIEDQLDKLLNEHDLHMTFLPTYLPELNPCELVFAKVKNYLRSNRSGVFSEDLLRVFGTVTFPNMFNFYSKCIDIFKITSF